MATTIKWIDNNKIETAHRIYKSSTYFTKDNLPVPLVELGPDVTEYVDSAGTDGKNWYIVSALLNDYEVFSEPFIAGLNTVYIHDVFNDGSTVATYNFDGNATDLGGNTSIDLTGFSYVSGLFGQAIDCGSSTAVRTFTGMDNLLGSPSGFSASMWLFHESDSTGSNIRLLSQGTSSLSQSSIGVDYDKLVIAGTDNTKYTSVNTIPFNTWTHCIWSHNASTNETSLYINGVLDATVSPANLSVNTELYFATWSAGSLQYNSPVDQFRIFNRPLTQEEVDTLYQEGAAFL